MSKRTSGKWELLTDFSVWSPSENALVCVCHSGDRRLRDTREISQEEAHANARLIAAAPCLLVVAECEEALDMPIRDGWPVLERYGWRAENRFDLPADEFVRRLRRAALAKARGEHQ